MLNKFISQILSKCFILLWCSTLSISLALAQPPQGKNLEKKLEKRSMRIFSHHDENQDGVISRKEYTKFIE